MEELLEYQGPAQDVRSLNICRSSLIFFQILTQTVQNHHALHEVEARKREIVQLEKNIKVSHVIVTHLSHDSLTYRNFMRCSMIY